MTSTPHIVAPALLAALLAASVPALAADPKTSARKPPIKAAKSTPCPKDQVEITSKVTGATYCAAMGGITVMGGVGQPFLLPEKPAPKSKK